MGVHGQPLRGRDATRRRRTAARLPIAILLVALAGCSGSAVTGESDAADTAAPTDTAEPVDTGLVDTVETDTAVADTAVADTEPDTEPTDTGLVDTEPLDTEPLDTTPTDTEPLDTTPADTEPLDTTPADTGPAPCLGDEDCADHDFGPCATPHCDDGGACVGAPAHEGDACEDGNLCTTGEQCASGACVPAAAVSCVDTNPCTDDTCDPAVGCRFKNNFAACDDLDPCTDGDRCSGGTCLSGGPACDDDNPCTNDACETDGTCVNAPDDALTCSDGSDCTAGDFCDGGVCVSGPGDGCDDGNGCTADACAANGLSCTHTNDNGASCDDANACTDGDRCVNGNCVSGGAIDCGGSPGCVDWTCDPVSGCALEALHVGAPCTDLDKCTEGDTCDATGSCVAVTTKDCDDGNPCTFDSCLAATGCKFQITVGVCDDSNLCTTDDKCVVGQCRGTPRACDDGDACTFDSCDPLLGCQFLPGGVSCDDTNPCTDDRCDSDDGCVHSPSFAPCDDGKRCTVDDTCTLAGVCVGAVDDCDDGDPCTADFCDLEEGCHNEPFTGACEDGDACTSGETCDAGGSCAGGTAIEVDDAVACTVDSCDPASGGAHTPDHSACSLGEACDPQLGCTAVTPLVLVTRIMLAPIVADDAEPGFGQWVVLTNATDAALDLAGWALANGDEETALLAQPGGSPAPILPARASIAAVKASATAPPEGAGAFALVYGAPDDGFAFAGAGDRVALLDADAAEVDAVELLALATEPGEIGADAFPIVAGHPVAFDATRLAAVSGPGANDGGGGWCVGPDAPESLAPIACDRAVLNEVRLGGPDGDRWIELYLPIGGVASGQALHIVAADGGVLAILPITGRMPIGGALLVRDGVGLPLPRVSDGAVQLVRSGELVDVYGFGAPTGMTDEALGLPMFEANPGPPQDDGDVAWRRTDGLDTDDNAADWVTGPDGSPGALNAP